VAHVLAIKRALGDRASVRVDVNQAWSELDAVRGIAQLEAGGIDLIEQPVRAENRDAMRRLAAASTWRSWPTRRCTARSTPGDIARMDGADVFAVKIAQSGGLFPAQEVATVAQLAGIGLYGGTMLEGGIGTAATAHLCATFADLSNGTPSCSAPCC
jgi:muconate cycloisomerase